jgi:hypothetical protein
MTMWDPLYPRRQNVLVHRPDRHFRWWDFDAQGSRLLLRSPATSESPTRLDVVFRLVEAVSLPVALPGLIVSEAEPRDTSVLRREAGLAGGTAGFAFLVRWRTGEGYVVAGLCVQDEDELGPDAPSRLWPRGSTRRNEGSPGH